MHTTSWIQNHLSGLFDVTRPFEYVRQLSIYEDRSVARFLVAHSGWVFKNIFFRVFRLHCANRKAIADKGVVAVNFYHGLSLLFYKWR